MAFSGACVGQITDGPEASPGAPAVAFERFSRLSHAQWERTVVDLFHLDAPTGLSESFAPDALGGKVFDDNQTGLSVTPSLWLNYQAAAETLAARVTSDTTLLARIADPSETDAEKAFLESFGRRAFRRPLSAAEVAARRKLFDAGRQLFPELAPFVAGVRLSVSAFLQSPSFLYRAEPSAHATNGADQPLNDWELASRLSYALWGSMPDDELFQAAAAGELSTPSGLHAQVLRMLDAPAARATVTAFVDELSDADQYLTLRKDQTAYPDFVPDIGADMRVELHKFAADVFARGGGFRELLTSPTTFVTPRLAKLYGLSADGLPAADDDGFSRVALDPSQRSGLLTRVGFLAWRGKDAQPNSIQRGVFVLRRIICQQLGDPPAAAASAALGDQPTNRARVEALTGSGTCGAACHGTFINPAGFAFEHFGAMGEYRDRDDGAPIDSTGTYPFQSGLVSFSDAGDFSAALAASPQVHACLTGYLVDDLLGREAVDADGAARAELAQRSLSGASLRDLVVDVLEGDLLRRPLRATEAP